VTRRARRPAARAVPGGITLAIAVAAAVSGCTSTPEVPTPGLWEGSGGSVILDADGAGRLEGVPVQVGPECREDAFTPVDADVEWAETEPGTIHVTSTAASITLWADRGGFGGDISWWKIAVGPCGDSTTGAQVLTYTRDTTFGDEG
jgi:hypothetical protein